MADEETPKTEPPPADPPADPGEEQTMTNMTVRMSRQLKAAVERAAEESGRTPTEEAKHALIQHMRTQGRIGSDAHRAGWDDARAEIAHGEELPLAELRPI